MPDKVSSSVYRKVEQSLEERRLQVAVVPRLLTRTPLMLPDFLGLMSFFVERSASAASSAGGAASVIALLAIVNFLELIGNFCCV